MGTLAVNPSGEFVIDLVREQESSASLSSVAMQGNQECMGESELPLYHYTHLENAGGIAFSGELKVEDFSNDLANSSALGIPVKYAKKLAKQQKKFKGLLWASSNPVWEPTVLKSTAGSFTSSREALNNLTQKGIVCVRFLLPPDGFTPAKVSSVMRLGKRSRTAATALFNVGSDVSAHWFIAGKPLLHDQTLGTEMWDGSAWVSCV